MGTIYYTLNPVKLHPNRIRAASINVGVATEYSSRNCIEFTAQDDPDRLKWYAGRVNAEHSVDGYGEDNLALATRLARAINKQRANVNQPDHIALLQGALAAIKAVPAVYDCRVSEVVAVADAMPSDYAPWRDDHIKMGQVNGCTFSAIARDDDEARAMMILKFKEDMGSAGWCMSSRKEYFECWMKAGAPIRRLVGDSWRAPEVLKWDDLFAHQKAEVVA